MLERQSNLRTSDNKEKQDSANWVLVLNCPNLWTVGLVFINNFRWYAAKHPYLSLSQFKIAAKANATQKGLWTMTKNWLWTMTKSNSNCSRTKLKAIILSMFDFFTQIFFSTVLFRNFLSKTSPWITFSRLNCWFLRCLNLSYLKIRSNAKKMIIR